MIFRPQSFLSVGLGVLSVLVSMTLLSACKSANEDIDAFNPTTTLGLSVTQSSILARSVVGVGRLESAARIVLSTSTTAPLETTLGQIVSAVQGSTNCTTSTTLISVTTSTNLVGEHFSTTGAGCPLRANYKIIYATSGSGSYTQESSAVLDGNSLRIANDIYSVQVLTRTGGFTQQTDGAESIVRYANLATTGNILSLTLGSISYQFTVSTTTAIEGSFVDKTGFEKFNFNYPGNFLELKKTFFIDNSVDSSVYTANGATITATQYNSVTSQMGTFLKYSP